MDSIFRFSEGQDTFFAVHRAGVLYRASLRGSSLFDGYALDGPLDGSATRRQLLAPVIPSKFVCVGLNYRDHAAEMNKPLPAEPYLFLKPSTSTLAPGGTILLPPGVGRVDHEAELAVVMGKRAHRVPRGRAWEYVFGLTCVNDVTARDIQNREVQYTRAKGFDSFAPIGPCIATGLNEAPRTVQGFVNGVRRQHSSTSQLIFQVDELIEYITFVMTLEPGDVISTGTPSGVGPLVNGDTVTVSIEGIGALTNTVAAERD
jgi:2-keto-4-pentenoate hydratase/2-oxohepta-3-ene-1,7-dioic acid hydratase in catechol pathway